MGGLREVGVFQQRHCMSQEGAKFMNCDTPWGTAYKGTRHGVLGKTKELQHLFFS
jgi:hypothetical protein